MSFIFYGHRCEAECELDFVGHRRCTAVKTDHVKVLFHSSADRTVFRLEVQLMKRAITFQYK